MKNLENFKVEELNSIELSFVNGGESGWYYAARHAKINYLIIKHGVSAAFSYIDSL